MSQTSPIRCYMADVFRCHDPGPHPERPARYDAVREAVEGSAAEVAEAPAAPIEALERVHDSGYLAAMERYCAAGGGQLDPDTIVNEFSFDAALRASGAAMAAVDAVLAGEVGSAFICGRPPGHHAEPGRAMGFCYLNNVAIAAQRLLAKGVGPLAILDIDVHHGNGTQSIFYARDDVGFVSVHSDPAQLYPYFAGYAEETGTGRGLGRNLNLPLTAGTGDAGYIAAVEQGLAAIARQKPAALLVSLGFDPYQGDPTANLAVTTPAFGVAGQLIGGLGLPTLLVQEGGYVVDRLGDNLTGFLTGFFSRR